MESTNGNRFEWYYSQTLRTEDLLFSLCIHGSRHLWERLLWICDVGWLIQNYDLNWQQLLDRARRTKTERMFLLGLVLCENLLDVHVPDDVSSDIKADTQLRDLAESVTKNLFQAVEHQPATPFRIFEYNVKVRRSWSSRARYFRHMLSPTDRDVHGVALPPLSLPTILCARFVFYLDS